MATHERADKIQIDKEPHRETTDATKFRQDGKFAKIVDGRVDPTTTLREQHSPRDWCHGPRDCIRLEFGLKRREVLHKERRQVTIFAE